ncbi:tRNA pseudouridine(55) synthase TruB [Marinicella sp. S1101]|uniref:tRNA pseudouridine(55) synthase TruB n=1 Tax=Marinicella marina TaxID=2996016 RepID=UPI00226090F8|nr:tRNA pseudouridine(55) synthase TruB [Marinicella marina]MCX7552849.1 tRNA pseudouridine(55) synthase TruB [Marinicella marina]MDJ1139842.1 tRNA pseudouridine(55) synthase TruB [Marinicella marina]
MANHTSAKRKYPDVHGIILLNKPKGISSNLALQKLRHLIKAKKAGHTGNLDPMATGLLPCCFGDATKVAHLLINSDKTYLARCVLGSQTDTGDATGQVVQTAEKQRASDTEIKQACQSLTGEIEQIPPMYSALHHNGQRLYDLARQGKTVERPARKVTIHEFSLVENTPEHIDFEIKVSKGTYIRTLLEDFAKAMGTVAHMSALHRTQTGIFSGDDMLTLEAIGQLDDFNSVLMPMQDALIEYPRLDLSQQQTQDLIHGKTVQYTAEQDTYCLYDHHNKFLGLGVIKEPGILKVQKLFLKSYSA